MIEEDHIRPHAEKLGIRPKDCTRFGLHNLRHSLATWLVESGVKRIVVVRMLRWSDAKMLHTYAHLDKTARRAQGEFLAKLLRGKRVQKRVQQKRPSRRKGNLERETGFEPATSTLARSHSTAELLPLVRSIITNAGNIGQRYDRYNCLAVVRMPSLGVD
jgi:Phage integrase family